MEKRAYFRWKEEACMESAKRFETRSAWEKGDTNAYQAAHRLKIVDKCCAHMTRMRAAKKPRVKKPAEAEANKDTSTSLDKTA